MGLPTLFFETGINASGFDRGLAALQSKAAGFSGHLTSLFRGPAAALSATFSVGSVVALGKGFVDAGAEMETFETRLGTLMGSTTEAHARMAELYDYAATTPFNTAEIVGAEVTLRGFGAAAEELMPGLIDFAATTGTDLPQAAIDFGKAWNQGAVGLESDGGKILRKQIEIRAGMDATKMSIGDFRQAMQETLSEGMFAGGAMRMSTTFAGMVSNLEDTWSGFQRQVADAGLFDNVKGALAGILDYLNQNQDVTKDWAGVVSDTLWLALKGVAYTIATALTGVQGMRIVFNDLVSLGANLGSTLITATQPLRDLERAAAARLGLDGVVAMMDIMDDRLGAVNGKLVLTAVEAKLLEAQLLGTKPPIEVLRETFAAIEASTGAAADNVRDLGKGKEPAGGDDKQREAEEKAARAWWAAVEAHQADMAKLQAVAANADADTMQRQLELQILVEQDPRHKIELQHLADVRAVRAAEEDRYRALGALRDAAVESALDDADRLDAEQQYQAGLVAIHRDAAAQIAIIDQQTEDARRAQSIARTEETMAAVSQVGEAVSQALTMAYSSQSDTISTLQQQLVDGEDYYTAAQKEQLTARLEATKKAARRSFEMAKIGTLASIVVNTQEGVSKALASAVPPVNFVLAGITAAAGATAFATAAAQKPAFHSGGLAGGLLPDEQLSRTLPGEAWLSRTGRSVMGDDAINKANAAVTPPQQRIVVESYYGHRLMDRGEADRLKMGSPYVNALDRLRVSPVGHWAA